MSQADAIGAGTPVRTGLGPWLLHRICASMTLGTLRVTLPDGRRLEHRGALPGPEASLVLHRWRALRRLVLQGDIGFGEAYVDGDWSSPDVAALLELAGLNEVKRSLTDGGAWPVRLMHKAVHRVRANTRSGSRRNIVRHYDLGNAFYAAWLDRGMSYSSALFGAPGLTLEEAQLAKQARILDLLRPEPGQSVLEIGCGWGGLAEALAAAGTRVTALTLSPSQLEFATRRLAESGLSAHADLRLQDYRDVGGQYDRIVSIEMLEAVGEAFWPVFFDTLRRRLKPAGNAILQVITITEERFEVYRRRPDFIQRHVFPGGMLPSPTAMRAEIARAGLMVDSVETFGQSYARTLTEWRDRFHAAWPALAELGFSDRFRRLWDYYLNYCEAGFRAGAIDVGLWRLRHAD